MDLVIVGFCNWMDNLGVNMVELKTLEDIEICKYFDYCVNPTLKCKEECYCPDIKQDLKDEATNHIKVLDFEEEGSFQVKAWIMDFFNLEESNLK